MSTRSWSLQLRALRLLFAGGCLALLAGCSAGGVQQPASGPSASVVQPSASAAAARSSGATSDWHAIHPGLAWRTMPAPSGTVRVLRVDPAQVRLRVVYDPRAPKRVSEWTAALDPLAVINGGYFEATNEASALTISDGVVTGESYTGFGGMLVVTTADAVSLQALDEQPYAPDPHIVQALQSFPRLVAQGQALALPNDNGQVARRTVVALDRAGNVLFLVNDQPQWTLPELARWLAGSDLGIEAALNLDGGPSTGMALRTGDGGTIVDSETPIPQVLVIEAR